MKCWYFEKMFLYFSWNNKKEIFTLEIGDLSIRYISYFSSHDGKGIILDHAILKAPLHKAVAITVF